MDKFKLYDSDSNFDNSTIYITTGADQLYFNSHIIRDAFESNGFYTEEMLDFLLEEIKAKKAKETDEKLKKITEQRRRDDIKKFIKDIRNVYFNYPYTIVIWKDGSKTKIKCQEDDIYDKEKGLALCIIKHIFGDTNYFNEIFKTFIKEDK